MDPLRQRFLRREDRLGSAYAASSSPSRASRTNTTHWDGGRPSYEDYYEGIYADLESGSSSGRPSYSNRPSLEQPNRSSSSLMPLFPHGNMNTMSSQDESPADPTSRQDNTRAKGKATDNNTAKEKAPAIGQVLLQPEHIETITPERGFYGHKRYLWEWLPGTPDYKYLTAWITRFEVEFGDTMCQKVSYQMEDGEVIESAPSEWISGMLRTFSNEVVPIQNMVIIFAEGGVLDSDGSIAINNHVHRPIRQWVPSIESTATFNRADLSNIGDNTLVIDMSLNLDALTAIHRAGKKPAGIFKMIMHQADRRSFNIERHFNWRHNLDFASRLRSHATFGRQKVPANNLYVPTCPTLYAHTEHIVHQLHLLTC